METHYLLQRSYRRLLLPAAVGLGLLPVIRHAAPGTVVTDVSPWALGPMFFIVAVTLAVAGPILLRSAFAQQMRCRQRVSEDEFLRFQRRVIRCALFSVYLACAAAWLALPRFHATGILLAALYAAYYHYPSRRRIDFDRRLFRVGETPHAEPT